jgi:cobalt/nickel transport system permease protein
MAIVGSLVAYLVYRLLAGRAALTAPRRVVAAALAGYIAINASAFCAAVELGIQPLLFRDASGAPLYAPYPLSIAIPAMMLGHLTFAGLAELVLSGGVVAYFQRANPSLLKLTAPGASRGDEEPSQVTGRGAWSAMKPLWTALALLLILTPLGTLAGGAAWGEWGARDFSDAAARRRIAAASRNLAPPPQAPQGLERLYSVWTAPFPQYAPSFVRRPALGYLLSAMFGSGIIILSFMTASALFAQRGPTYAAKNKSSVFSEPPKPQHGEHEESQ